MSEFFKEVSAAIDLNFFEALRRDLGKYGDRKIILVDSETIFSRYFESMFEKIELRFEKIKIKKLKNNLENTGSSDEILFFSEPALRIFNINFNRVLKKEYGKPYLVLITSNRGQHIKRYFEEKYFRCIFNPLLELPHFAKAYLKNPALIRWLMQDSICEAHNDALERNIFLTELRAEGIIIENAYVGGDDFNLLTYEKSVSDLFCNEFELLYSHYPIHRVYKKYLNEELSVNLIERNIYGEVN